MNLSQHLKIGISVFVFWLALANAADKEKGCATCGVKNQVGVELTPGLKRSMESLSDGNLVCAKGSTLSDEEKAKSLAGLSAKDLKAFKDAKLDPQTAYFVDSKSVGSGGCSQPEMDKDGKAKPLGTYRGYCCNRGGYGCTCLPNYYCMRDGYKGMCW